MYPVFGQFPYLRILTGVRFIGATSQPTLLENAEIMRGLVPICPNLRRISWFRGNQFDMDSIVAIEHNGSHVTWYILREWGGREGSIINTGWGEIGHGSFELDREFVIILFSTSFSYANYLLYPAELPRQRRSTAGATI
jgi:hypothetical protein